MTARTTPTPGPAPARTPAPAPAHARKRDTAAARRTAWHRTKITGAEDGSAALKAAFDFLWSTLKRIERADPAAAERYRHDAAHQVHDFAATLATTTKGRRS